MIINSNDVIGWNYGFYSQTYISINYRTVARTWQAWDILEKAFKISETDNIPVRSAIIKILKSA